jgi:meso-butanediol dehydrogenase / (S,S)-butanediol dehydrogenase / diacetyl reductase
VHRLHSERVTVIALDSTDEGVGRLAAELDDNACIKGVLLDARDRDTAIAAVAEMRRGFGTLNRLVNRAGILGVANRLPYLASKLGVAGTTRSMSPELGPLGT